MCRRLSAVEEKVYRFRTLGKEQARRL